MLIVTAAALGLPPHLPDWPGARVVVVGPGDGLRPADLDRLDPTAFVLEYLDPPPALADLLCDLAQFMAPHLARNDHALVFAADAAPGGIGSGPGDDPEAAPVDLVFHDDRISRLRLSSAIAASPLLPAFLDFARGRDLSDRDLAALLTTAFGPDAS